MILATLVAARWLHFSALAVILGSGLFGLSIDRAARGASRLVGIAAVAAAVTGLAWLLAAIANMSGDAADAFDAGTLHAVLFETDFGRVDGLRLVLLLLIAAGGLVPMAQRFRTPALATTAAALLVSQAWIGHAAGDAGSWRGTAMILAYVVHVLAGAAWVGSLPALVLSLRERPALAALTLQRYGAAALGAALVAVLSGCINALFRLDGDLAAVTASAYGRVLLVKTGLLAAMLACAAMNRFVLRPDAEAIVEGSDTRTLRVSIVVETVLALGVLGAAAILGVLAPPS